MASKPDYMSQEEWDNLDPEAQNRVAKHVEGGGSNKWKMGDRISKKAWDAMSQGERDAIGLSDWSDFKAAKKSYQARWTDEGDLGMQRNQQGMAALDAGLAGAGSWNQAAQILQSVGVDPDSPWFKELRGKYMGNIDQSGLWHKGSNGWVNVGTSDLTAIDKPTWNPNTSFGGGIEAVLASNNIGKWHSDKMRNENWYNSGHTSMEGRTEEGGYYNMSPNGTISYFDKYGRPTKSGTPSESRLGTGNLATARALSGSGPTGINMGAINQVLQGIGYNSNNAKPSGYALPTGMPQAAPAASGAGKSAPSGGPSGIGMSLNPAASGPGGGGLNRPGYDYEQRNPLKKKPNSFGMDPNATTVSRY